MSEAEIPSARTRARRWFSWIWLAPLLAVAVVLWLAVRALVDRGPLITISFSDAEGLQAGDTRIRHKDVELGKVESIHLTPDMSRVIVKARMRRSVAPHLTANTRFWIVRPRVGIGGISGLSTLVSGSYIEMYPGDGGPQRMFVGLDDPPALTPNTPGRSFTLHTDDLGSLTAGSPVSFRGVPVGEVQGFQLDPSGKQINVFAFVRAPYEKYVSAQTRFWNSGGIDVAVGVEGLRFRASTWQQLISGGVSFDTPATAVYGAESAAGTVYRLYENQDDAQRDPRGATLVYRVDFMGGAGDVGAGTSVQLEGTDVGEVTDARLLFDDASQSVVTRVTMAIDPTRVQIIHRRQDVGADASAALNARLEMLVAHGLRAHLVAANFLTGAKVVSLDMIRDARPAHIRHEDGVAEFPTSSANDISAILASAQRVLHHIDAVTAGPELGHAIKELDRTLSNLDQLTTEVEPQVKPVMKSLRDAAEAAQRTLQAANNVLGTGAASSADLPRLIREMTETARSLRDLADYLDRHPESLIRGRQPEKP
ncbi:MAG TPA: MlaD family protein [Steroidobacteraceae bacterium]